jgi:hypothetical protein
LILALLLGQAGQSAAATTVVPPTRTVDGETQAEYAARWWQWANRVRPGVKPFQDPTGSQCALNQSGKVWYLAGTDGTDDIRRRCTVPKGKYLFFPIINMISHSLPGKPLTCDQAKAEAAANNEHLVLAEVKIDNTPVRNIPAHRIRSTQCFDAFPIATYIDNTKSYFPAATDGYWLMLEPLSSGLHHIVVRARYDNPGANLGDLEQNFEYQLQVEEQVKDEEPVNPEKLFEGLIVAFAPLEVGSKSTFAPEQ